MPYQDVMRSIALFGSEVDPALHAITLPPYASATGPSPGTPARTRQGCGGGQPKPARWGRIASERRDEMADAQDYTDESLPIFEKLGARSGVAWTLHRKGVGH